MGQNLHRFIFLVSMSMLVGFTWVSIGDQSFHLQKDALAAACGQIFTDVTAWTKSSFPGLDAALG